MADPRRIYHLKTGSHYQRSSALAGGREVVSAHVLYRIDMNGNVPDHNVSFRKVIESSRSGKLSRPDFEMSCGELAETGGGASICIMSTPREIAGLRP